MKYQATRETLERLAEAVDAFWNSTYEAGETVRTHGACADALAAYRAELRPPLRSREEVDAEIVAVVRMLHQCGSIPDMRPGNAEALNKLCAEPTRETEKVEEKGSHFWCPATGAECQGKYCIGAECQLVDSRIGLRKKF